MAANSYAGLKTGAGTPVPVMPNGAVDINALIANMLDRGIWDYYYTLYIVQAAIPLNTYALFNAPMNAQDPYPPGGTAVTLTKTDTNMPQACSAGFSAPRDLLLDSIGFEFINTTLADIQAFSLCCFFEFKIIDKVYFEGPLQDHPPGIGIYGHTTASAQQVWGYGMPAGKESRNRFGTQFGKYIAPQMQFSLNLFFPKTPILTNLTGIGGGAGTFQTTAQGGTGVSLKVHLFGLTDRAVQ